MAGLDGDFRRFDMGATGRHRLRMSVSLAGAAVSGALVVGLALWGYRLAVRDVSGIPVVRALEGPIRIAPETPGGDIAAYQGLAVNEVAAVGTAATPPDRLMLAPRPVELSPDDAPGLGPLTVPDTDAVVAQSLQTALEPAPVAEAIGTEDAIALALAEALADDEGTALADPDLPAGAMARSIRPVTRPGAELGAVADVASTPVVDIVEVDPATLTPGTRLVQFGAFATRDAARAAWVNLLARAGDLMGDKAMVIEAATSGGQEFYRLRAHGFADEIEARRFCSAMLADIPDCIPVAVR
ncbi:MAG: SPOR domain-containing protein [Pseudomonadota bacterium]